MAEKTIRLKRTSLYASGVSPVNMVQAVFYNEDMLIYDLEDSVPASEKDAARFLVYQMVKHHRPKDKYVGIRVNGIYSEYLEEDLQAAVRAKPDFLRIPKVEYAREVQDISNRIAAIEEKIGMETGSIDLVVNVESYMGVINAMEIAKASPRIVAMAVSAEDLTASLKAQRTKQGLEVFYARNAVLLACRAAGIDALDVVFSDINDVAGLKEDTALAKNLGFDGKTCIHPRQIDTVNTYFTPSMKEIRYALRVLEAVEEGKRQKKGAVVLDGGMIDKPMELRALTTLAQAEAAGLHVRGEEKLS
ncbi:MAG: HpcH/HpaI aldolase/citrate lyase family protein [Lachnospiraceae bacterium]|jgi:citrate lyase subunit beta/citryl-CoA lyase|nr:HpcH/HpaI aldolase/citrate lyase family protein [Lachnospiraceae bacterium]